jgi:PKD repeat protein
MPGYAWLIAATQSNGALLCCDTLQVCLSCGLKSLTSSTVACLPGTYTLTYSVTNDNGATATATRSVIIYTSGQLSVQLPLYQELDNGTAAGLTVQALSNTSSAEATAAANSIASRVSTSSAGLEVQPSDVSLLQVQLVELGPSNFSVHVTALIYTYFPAFVHRKDVINTAAAAAAPASSAQRSNARRTLSTSSPTTPAALAPPPGHAFSADIRTLTNSLRQLATAVTHEAHLAQHAALTRTACSTASSCSNAGRRRLLQATDTGIVAQLASMTAAAASSLAPTSVTGQQTSAEVDPVMVSTAVHDAHV